MRRMQSILLRRFHEFIPSKYLSLPAEDRYEVINCAILKDIRLVQKELNGSRGALKCALQMREDIIIIQNNSNASNSLAALKSLEQLVFNWLNVALAVDNLLLQRISFETSSGNTLENIVNGERVHRVKSMSELKSRLHNGCRCFAFFHNSLPSTPLIFIHVALTSCLAKSMRLSKFIIEHFMTVAILVL